MQHVFLLSLRCITHRVLFRSEWPVLHKLLLLFFLIRYGLRAGQQIEVGVAYDFCACESQWRRCGLYTCESQRRLEGRAASVSVSLRDGGVACVFVILREGGVALVSVSLIVLLNIPKSHYIEWLWLWT